MIQVLIDSVDRSDLILWDSLRVSQILTSQVDTCDFKIRRLLENVDYIPNAQDEVLIKDGDTKIFGGRIKTIDEETEVSGSLLYTIKCADYTSDLDSLLVAKSYETMTVKEIVEDLISEFAPDFTSDVSGAEFEISKIVFNQIPISSCLKKLADLLSYEWYVDPEKVVRFFQRFTITAPFNLTDDSGNYVYKSLKRVIDGTQIVNEVIVRGGLGVQASTYSDIITVSGSSSKSFALPYQFAVSGLVIEVDTGAGYVSKTVGIDGIDSLDDYDCLYNYKDHSIQFASALADTNKIRFTGYKTYYVKSIASDYPSILTYGLKQKLIREEKIVDTTTARQRAVAELQTYKDAISELNFRTYDAGLRTGMVMTFNSTQRAVSDLVSIINKVDFKTIDPMTFYYDVNLITTKKQTLIEILVNLIRPDDIDADENEIAEVIKTDLAVMNLAEAITSVAGYQDNVIISMSENVEDDPLGAGVEPTWVLGDYFPIGQSIDQQNTSSSSCVEIYTNQYIGQSFTVGSTTNKIRDIGIYVNKVGSPSGNLNASIYNTDVDGKPTGSPLQTISILASSISSSAGYEYIPFNCECSPNTKYCIIMSCPDADYSNYIYIYFSENSAYANGTILISDDSGATWDTDSVIDLRFIQYKDDPEDAMSDPKRNGLLDISLKLG